MMIEHEWLNIYVYIYVYIYMVEYDNREYKIS